MRHEPTETSDEAVDDVERLIGRMIDGEATDEDRARFEAAATLEPALWRRLAEMLEQRSLLAEQVDREIAAVDDVGLPASRAAGRRSVPAAAWSGWAAVIMLGAAWAISAMTGRSEPPPFQPVPAISRDRSAAALTPDEHLASYLRAPFVLGELDPILLQADELSDGRVALRYLRRVEEVAFLDAAVEVPASPDGRLLVSPEQLRSESGETSERSDRH